MFKLKWTPLLAVIVLVGCDQTDSGSVATSQIAADFKVISTSSDPDAKVMVTAKLTRTREFNAPQLELDPGDELTVTAAGVTTTLHRSPLLFVTQYEAEVDNASTHTQFVIAFNRVEDTSAPSSIAQLPDPFDISPMAASYHLGDTILLTWTAAVSEDEVMFYSHRTSCEVDDDTVEGTSFIARLVTGDTVDDGTLSLNIDDFIYNVDRDTLVACEAHITLERRQEGSVDPNFGAGGDFIAIQERSLEFEIVLP